MAVILLILYSVFADLYHVAPKYYIIKLQSAEAWPYFGNNQRRRKQTRIGMASLLFTLPFFLSPLLPFLFLPSLPLSPFPSYLLSSSPVSRPSLPFPFFPPSLPCTPSLPLEVGSLYSS